MKQLGLFNQKPSKTGNKNENLAKENISLSTSTYVSPSVNLWDHRITEMTDRVRNMTSSQRLAFNFWQIDHLCETAKTATLQEQDKKISKILNIKPIGF